MIFLFRHFINVSVLFFYKYIFYKDTTFILGISGTKYFYLLSVIPCQSPLLTPGFVCLLLLVSLVGDQRRMVFVCGRMLVLDHSYLYDSLPLVPISSLCQLLPVSCSGWARLWQKWAGMADGWWGQILLSAFQDRTGLTIGPDFKPWLAIKFI